MTGNEGLFGVLIQWLLGVVVVVLSGAWQRTASKIAKNQEVTVALREQVAELRGRQDAMEKTHGDTVSEIRNLHHRVGGVGQTADHMSGQLTSLNQSVTLLTEHLLQREKATS